MPRKRLPILQIVSKLLKVSIFIGKMRKPIAQKLELMRRKSQETKKLKLLKHYNYGFLGESEFSPSSTPLITYHRKHKYYSMFFLCRCLGRLQSESGEEEEEEDYSLEALPTIEDIKTGALLELPLYCGNEEDSIDLQAERFIQRFYEEMRMQRMASI